MRERKAIGILLLFSALILLTTCQLQFNKSSGNSVYLRIIVPATASGGRKGTPALGTNAKDIGGGTSLTVTISQEGTTFSAQQTVSIDGKTSIDFSFTLSSKGTYDVSAQMLDGSGNLLSTVSTKLTVPTGNYPVVLRMPSNLLNAVVADSITIYSWLVPFSPTTYSGNSMDTPCPSPPVTLTLTTVDPNATITSVTEYYTTYAGVPTTSVPSHIGSTYALTYDGNEPDDSVTIIVTAPDGTTQTYTLTINWGGC